MSPAISLVITNYNRAPFLDRAIRSCIGQVLFRVPYEIIVIDDASTDDSNDVIAEFGTDVVHLRNEVNQGVAATSNLGLEAATGEYWMRVDADDFLGQFSCTYMKDILDHNPGVDFVFCDHFRVDMRGVMQEHVRLDNDEALFNHGAGVMFRTESVRDAGGYDESLRNCEDYDLLVRMKALGSIGFHLPIPLYRYYIHGDNLTLSQERQSARELVRKRHGLSD